MDPEYAQYVRERFDSVQSSGVLNNIFTTYDFRSLIFELFFQKRRLEIEQRLKRLNDENAYNIVKNPGDEWCVCRQIAECDDELIRIYTQKYFQNPPIQYLTEDGLFHMYYIPSHFLMAVPRAAKSGRLLKLLSDISFEQEARRMLLNNKEIDRL